MPFYLAVAGGRDFADYERMKEALMQIKAAHSPTHTMIIVSGGARGADALAKRAAYELGFQYIDVPAMWNVYGNSAGYKRNGVMVDLADLVLAFWDGQSKGTKHTIDMAKMNGTDLQVVSY